MPLARASILYTRLLPSEAADAKDTSTLLDGDGLAVLQEVVPSTTTTALLCDRPDP